jgi:ribosomal-protein-alanine N-acetyltransferase
MLLFETERLSVRRFGTEDAAFVLAMLTDPGFIANIGDRGVRTIEDAERYVAERIHGAYAEHGYGMSRVALKETDEPVGMVGLVRREGLDGPDLGFAYLAAQTGKGYGREAGRGMVDWAHGTLGIGPLVAITAAHNDPSARLLIALGFREEGVVAIPGHETPSRFFVEA